MAGRPRLYATAAEKTRAYREREEKRMVMADRITFEQMEEDLNCLRCCVVDAQGRGDELALSLDTRTKSDMLRGIALYFETGVITPRPNQMKTTQRKERL